MTLAFLALLGAPYIHEISSLRVNRTKYESLKTNCANSSNERGRDVCDRSASRHLLRCQVLTFGQNFYFPVPKPLSNEAKQCDSYFYERWSSCIAHETAICCRNPHKSSNWDSRITGQLGYKHTCCQNVVPTKEKCLSSHFPKNITCLSVGLVRIC